MSVSGGGGCHGRDHGVGAAAARAQPYQVRAGAGGRRHLDLLRPRRLGAAGGAVLRAGLQLLPEPRTRLLSGALVAHARHCAAQSVRSVN